MRLAVYSLNYWPEPTGIPYYNTGMCRWLAQRLGWQVSISTGLPHYPWWEVPAEYVARDYRNGRGDQHIDGVRIARVRHYVPAPPPSGAGRVRLDLSWLLATLWRGADQRHRPQAVVVVAPPFLVGLLGLWLARRWRVPVIYHVQDLQIEAALELGMLPRALTTVLLAAERFILRRVDLVTTISPAMQAAITAKTATRRPVAMFPNWANTTTMRPWIGANRFRAAWSLPDDGQVVVYSGNIGRKQGLEILIRAAAKLPSRVRVVIAGSGSERGELERLAAAEAPGRVLFQDLVAAADLPEFLSAADVHVIVQRGSVAGAVMPSKLINIMAVARPVVVTAIPDSDLAQAVERAGCGLVVAPENPAALAEGLTQALADPAMCARRGAAGHAWVTSELGANRILARFAARLVSMSQGQRRKR